MCIEVVNRIYSILQKRLRVDIYPRCTTQCSNIMHAHFVHIYPQCASTSSLLWSTAKTTLKKTLGVLGNNALLTSYTPSTQVTHSIAITMFWRGACDVYVSWDDDRPNINRDSALHLTDSMAYLTTILCR